MSATRNETTNAMYLSVKAGKFVRKTDKTEGEGIRKREYVDKETNQLVTVYEEWFDKITGTIVSCEIDSPDFGGKYIKLKFNEDDPTFVSINFGDANRINDYAKTFIQRCNAIDLTKEVSISAYQFIDKERSAAKGREVTVRGINVFQDGVKIANQHTKDNPNGLPPAVETIKFGEKKWDFSAQNEFYWQKLNEFISKFGSSLPF